MNKPQREVSIVAYWNIYRLALALFDPKEMAAQFIRSRAAFREMFLRKEV
jgi:hypothetical protein